MSNTVFPVIDLARTGRSIERHRRQAGLSVRQLQEYFGFEYPQAIYKWQHGECLPTVDNLLALARLLKVSMEDLLVYDDQEVPHFLDALAFNFSVGEAASRPLSRLRRQLPFEERGPEGAEEFCLANTPGVRPLPAFSALPPPAAFPARRRIQKRRDNCSRRCLSWGTPGP